jgi:hypothetical protein
MIVYLEEIDMKRLKMLGALSFMALFLQGCFLGDKVEIAPAEVGKVMGREGYRDGVVTTSRFRLDPCIVYCDRLVTMSIADFSVTEQMELFMPRDRLVMTFDLRLTMTPNPAQYDSLFDRIPAQEGKISLRQAYITYAEQIIRSEAREILSKYTINEIASSREAINVELTTALTRTINERTPFQVRYLGIADIGYPPVITQAQIAAAERREAIQQEEAQLEISKVQLERELQEERLKRAIEVEKAQAMAEVNRILADSVTPSYVTYRQLEALQTISASQNTKFLPVEMLSTMAGQVMVGNSDQRR